MDPTWYIIRHSLATHSTTGYGDHVIDAPILPDTIPAIEAMATQLSSIGDSINASSELLRCRQTAAIISAKTGKLFIFDKRLNEFVVEPPKLVTETFVDFKARIISFVQTMSRTGSERIIVVTHGAVVSALTHYLVQNNVTEQQLLEYPDCGVMTTIHHTSVTYKDFRTMKGAL
jgi:broad specificity phosphatase PhoE